MTADRRITIGGITDKPIHGHCTQDPIEAEFIPCKWSTCTSAPKKTAMGRPPGSSIWT
jgi:hypothetical protein